jgi:hypothetical protein
MVRVVVAARTNRVSPAQPVIVSDYLNGYSLSGDDGANGDGTLPLHFVRRLLIRDSRDKQASKCPTPYSTRDRD